MKFLFIGNSHTYFNDMPDIFKKLCASNGIEADCVMLAHGGMGLDFHLNQPEVKYNILYGGYDYVILQHIAHPFENEEVMISSGIELNKWIREGNATPVLYMTWSEKDNPEGQEKMTNAYRRLGAEINAIVAPVGVSWWSLIDSNPEIELYYSDGKHASEKGSLLAACTIFAAIFNKNPISDGENTLFGDIAFKALNQ